MSKRRVREQFTSSAEAYATSEIHAKGLSLERLLELTRPQPEWQVLDVATGAGHTAVKFAPHVRQVVASDITVRMLELTASLARDKGLNNVVTAAADAEDLPFDDSSFDLITCRVAAHHFPAVPDFMAESARALRPGGFLAIVDNVVPGGYRHGKQAKRIQGAARYINAFEALRDPSHIRCLTLDGWQRNFYEAGFRLVKQETADKMLDFHDWAARMRVQPADEIRLEAMLRQAPAEVTDFLRPEFDKGRIRFRLEVALLIGRIE
ncbi:MAG: class I SAM-dependent methyltransferase [Chloroflexota bacterium]|nr:MAG: class I SAM-dependent methyltransferase [Chloroflexota bacterium]